MRLKGKQPVGVLTLFVLAAPVWAHTHTATAYIIDTTTIAVTTLQPGQYELKVQDNGTQLQVMQNHKVVAQVPVQWIQLPNKAMDTQVVLSDKKITEVEFGGETQAVQINSN